MTSIFSSFFQVAGAKSFSDFLKEDDKKPRKRTKRRSLRKTVAQRKSRRKTARRTAKRTARRSSRRTALRSSRRTARKSPQNRRVKVRQLTKRKLKGLTGNYECLTCNKSVKAHFTGKEPSPKGLGYCARCTPLNITMKGKDGNLWENKKYSKGKRWVRV